MNSKLPLLIFLFSSFFTVGFSQEGKLEGVWKLNEIELNEFASEDLKFSKEESFFGNYLNPNELLTISSDKFPVVVGGDLINYDYSVKGSKLLLNHSNTILVLKDGKQEEFTSVGELDFKMKIVNGVLVLSRRNKTFFESYTFSKLN